MARPITAELVLTGYMRGAFPMCEPTTGRVEWFTCDPRALVPLDGRFRVSRSLQRVVRGGRFDIRVDTAFDRVIEGCARDRGSENRNWIGPDIRRVYGELHAMGFAHSVEAWRGGELVGGLYGVALKGAFFGESMFHVPGPGTDASKACLVHLVERLRRGGFTLCDSQYSNEHMAQFGVFEVGAPEYASMLEDALEADGRWDVEDDPLQGR
ncbi:MAG: leucyl/phenylalanyl-tRNA--protein transferase [Actinobacteria bacterium]|nr:leucyl/phenylalanyl-tRNA--protein transferase [Actinomycetota bacterium]